LQSEKGTCHKLGMRWVWNIMDYNFDKCKLPVKI
jgi:hypothetical protein